MLSISRFTLYRHLNEAGVSKDDFSQVSDQELDEAVKGIKRDFPNDGENLRGSHMLRVGFKVPRQRLRDAIHRVDHENTIDRRSSVIPML